MLTRIGGIARRVTIERDESARCSPSTLTMGSPNFASACAASPADLLIGKKLHQSWSQGRFSQCPDGVNGFAHDEIGGITQERREQGVEGIGQFAEEARDFQARTLAFLSALAGHFIENLASRFEALRFTGTREIGCHCGAN